MSNYFVYKKFGPYPLYWNRDEGEWVSRTKSTVYTEEEVEDHRKYIQSFHKKNTGTWERVVAEPVKYGEAPRPIPVIMGDGCTPVEVEGYYWIRNKKANSTIVAYLVKGNVFRETHMYIYIKEPNWP